MSGTHGLASTYRKYRCRCKKCRRAHADQVRRERQGRAVRLAADPSLAQHGSADTYRNWLCRCVPCTEAHSAHLADYRANVKSPAAHGRSTTS